MSQKKYTDKIEPDGYYHVFNRGINGCRIFNSEENCSYFLLKFANYIVAIADVFCYCLLPNHFHFLLKIKSEEEPLMQIDNRKTDIDKFVFQQFSNFFNSYAQAFNKQEGRTEKLFDLPFRRKKILNEEQLIQTVRYIHNNPRKHGIEHDVTKYPFSSFHMFLGKEDSFLKRETVINWFDGLDNFIYSNKNYY